MILTSNGNIIRWMPGWRRYTVVQPWTCLWVVPAHARLRCDGCHQRVTTRQCLAATWPSREDWRRGRLRSPRTGSIYCGDCARAWYGVWEADLQHPLPDTQLWDCWGPLVSLSRLVIEGPPGQQRFAYRLTSHWRDRVHRRA